MRRIPALLGGAVLLTMAAAPAPAQVPSTPRALGTAGAHMAFARGAESLFQNPAHLGLPDTPAWSLGFGQLAAGGTLAGAELGRIPDLLDWTDLPDDERDALFAEVAEAGLSGSVDVRAPLATLQVGPFAAGLAYAAVGDHGASRDLVELFLYGYEEGRTDYDVAGTTGSRATFWDLAVAYGDRIGPVSFGVTGHLLRGRTLLRSAMRTPRIDLVGRDIRVGYASAFVDGGTGYALDLGAVYRPSPALTVSAAVTNAYATLDWSDEVRVRDLVFTSADFEEASVRELRDRYEESEREAGPADEAVLRAVGAASLRDEAHLPTVARLGVGWEPAGGTRLSASWSSTLTDGALGGAWDRQAAVGVEQRLGFLGLHAGAATDLGGGSLLAAGLSLSALDLAVARLDRGGEEGSGWVGSIGISVGSPLYRGD